MIRLITQTACAILLLCSSVTFAGETTESLKVLLVTGGCCHDYDFQTRAMQDAAKKFGVAIDWKVVNDGGTGTSAEIDLYDDADWAKGFDVVVHNECFAKTTNPEYIKRITKAHYEGANGVVIHCAMHTYRDAEIDDWRQFLGVTSKHHEHQSNYAVRVESGDHPIVKHVPADYKTAMDELYIIKKVWPNTKVLATSVSEKTGKLQPVMWTNRYGKSRVFGTTYGHSNATFEDEVFLKCVVNGIVWAAKGDAKK